MNFKQYLTESPLRTGVHNSNNYSLKSDWNYYKNKPLYDIIKQNFTSKNYKILKTPTRMFIVDENNKYKLGIEYKIPKDKKGIEIEIAHSNERGLYNKFLDFLLHKYKMIFSGLQQSTQAEKSWKKLLDKYDIIVKSNNQIIDIDKKDIDNYYGKSIRIGIKESLDDNYEIRNNIINSYNSQVDEDKILFRSAQWE